MGILDQVFEIRAENSGHDFWYSPVGHSVQSKAGVPVNNDTALRCAAVYACVKIIAESIGSLPCHLYRRLPDGRGRERARDHWAYKLVRQQTGPRTPSGQWLETLAFHAVLTGNHYSVIDWRNDGEVNQLYPLNPDRVDVETSDRGTVTYKYQDNKGKEYWYADNNVLHVPAFTWDGITGVSPIGYARESIGSAIATEEFGARFFSNGTNMGTVYTMPEGVRLSPDDKDKMVEDLRKKHSGLGKAHNAILLPHGITASRVSIPPDDAQWIESRKLNKAEICSIFRVPLHMVQEHEKSTSWGTGIEHMNLGFIQHTLRPWLIRIEQMLNLKLLSGADRERYYFEFLPEALLRGDMKSSGEFYQLMIQNKVMTPNEVREKLNMNPVEWGDDPVAFENLHGSESQDPPANDTGDTEEKGGCGCGHEHRAEPDPELDHPRMAIQRSYRRVIRDAMARVIRRERNDIMRAAKKHLRKAAHRTLSEAAMTVGEDGIIRQRAHEHRTTETLTQFIEQFYSEHEEFTREAITPAFTALAEAIGAEAMREIDQRWEWNDELEQWLVDYIAAFANRHSNQSRGQLLQLIEEVEDATGDVIDTDDVIASLGQRFEEWEVGLNGGLTRDDKIAAREATRLGQGFTRAVFFAAGLLTLRWVATGSETCPYCQSLNGRTVGPSDVFIAAGEAFAPGGAEPLRPRSDVGHPPCHSGCDCIIVPG